MNATPRDVGWRRPQRIVIAAKRFERFDVAQTERQAFDPIHRQVEFDETQIADGLRQALKAVGPEVESAQVFQQAEFLRQTIDLVAANVQVLQVGQVADLFRHRDQLVVGDDQNLDEKEIRRDVGGE